MELKEIQNQFQQALLSKHSVGVGALFKEDRFQVYQDSIFIRFIDSLKEDFPKCVTMLGKREFERLAIKYIQMHPSVFSSLAEVSRGFSEFVERQGFVEAADVACLEWLQIEADSVWFEEEKFDWNAFLKKNSEKIFQCRFVLNPTLRLYFSKSNDERFLIYLDRDKSVSVNKINKTQFQILTHLLKGETLEFALEHCVEQLSEAELQSWFAFWVSGQLIQRAVYN